MTGKWLLGMTFATLLMGCEVPVMIAAEQNQGKMTGIFEITFPAVLLVRTDDGDEELLRGELIGHANGSARFALDGPTWGHCTGTSTKAGTTTMQCAEGVDFTMETGRQKAKMSGINVSNGTFEGTAFVSAFGWGNDASEAAVRAALAES